MLVISRKAWDRVISYMCDCVSLCLCVSVSMLQKENGLRYQHRSW